MDRQARFEEIRSNVNENISARIRIDPPLDTSLIQKIKMIKGVGYVSDGIDYAAIFTVSPKEILLESGCAAWCEHMQLLVHNIVEVLKQAGEVDYKGPSIGKLILNPRTPTKEGGCNAKCSNF